MPVVEVEPAMIGLIPRLFSGSTRCSWFSLPWQLWRDLLASFSSGEFPQYDVWYVVHGAIPANLLTLSPVVMELAERGVKGVVLGPVSDLPQFIPLPQGWGQIPLARIARYLSPIQVLVCLGRAFEMGRQVRVCLNKPRSDNRADVPKLSDLRMLCYLVLRSDRAIEKLISNGRPKVVLAGESNGMVYAPSFRAAKKLGAFGAVLQHGNVGPTATSIRCNEVWLWGKFYAERLAEWGVDRDKIRVVGSPRMDALMERKRRRFSADEVRGVLGVRPQERMIMHLSDGNFEATSPIDQVEEIWGELPEMLEEIADIARVFVKLHPGEDPAKWRGHLRRTNVVLLEGQFEFSEIVDAADLVTAVGSVAAIECACLGKPILFYHPAGRALGTDYAACGIGLSESESSGFVDTARRLLLDHDLREEAVRNSRQNLGHFFANSGRSAKVVAELVEERLRVPGKASACLGRDAP